MRYVAFLRAINVGDRRIKMAELAQVFGDSGCSNVSTFIASGNVIFDSESPPVVADLEAAFLAKFGFLSEIFLRDREQIKALLAAVPWSESDGVVEVSFLGSPPPLGAARELKNTAVAPERLLVSGSEVLFLRVGGGVPTTHKEATSMRILDMKMTRRGMRTVANIYNKFMSEETR